jgi:outer membrane protein TolC
MLRITIQKDARRLELAGKLAGPWVAETEKAWQAALAGKQIEVDLTQVTSIDDAGRRLLKKMVRSGAFLIARGLAMNALLEEIEASVNRSNAKRIAGVVFLALALSHAAHLQAQEAPTEPLQLTLRDAVDIALKQNPQVAIANLNLAESQESKNVARAALLPAASLNASENVTRLNVAALIGRTIPGFSAHSGPFWTTQVGPGFSAPLFDLTLWERWRASKESFRASEAEQTTARELNVQLVVSQYLGSLRASADVTAARSRLGLAKALLDLATDQLKNGVGTRIDTLRANVQYQNERQRSSDADSQLKISLYGLSRLLNLDPQQAIELTDAPSFFETPAVDSDESIARAYSQRPELKAILAQVKQAELQKRAASAERMPRLSFNGDWALQGLSPSPMIPAYQMGASLQVPLFTGGRIRAETATADLEIKKLEQTERDLRNQIAQDVKTALAQLEAARVAVEAANIGVSEAKEEVTQAEDRFRAGVTNNIEITTAQDELARANDNQIAALYNYNQARADLARATGRIEALYTK